MAIGLESPTEKVERGRCAHPCVWWFQLWYNRSRELRVHWWNWRKCVDLRILNWVIAAKE